MFERETKINSRVIQSKKPSVIVKTPCMTRRSDLKRHQLEVELLKREIEELKFKNRVLSESNQFYANPLCKFDKGKIAQEALKKNSKSYKSVNPHMSYLMKEKEIKPFVTFQLVIPTDEEQTYEEE